ncbi:hypothetical protein [Flavobacterium columnare]|nr:hypothetical protein [Flavobacterium columnare]
MKLDNLNKFQTIETTTSFQIYGGKQVDSEKKDVGSTSQDCLSGDTYN